MPSSSWAGIAIALAASGCGLFPSFDRLSGGQKPRDAGNDAPESADGNVARSNGLPPRCVLTESYLKAETPHRSAMFGVRIAVEGHTMIVVAPLEKNPWPAERSNTDPEQMCDFQQGILDPKIQGSAVIRAFDRVGSEWKQLPPVELNPAVRTERAIVDQALLPSSIKTAVLPAYSLALTGTWLAVGTAGDSSRGPFRGSVHVFRRTADTWTERFVIENDDGADGDLFGFAVALSDDLLVVGAPGEDARGLDAAAVAHAGAAHTYRLVDTGAVQLERLTAPFVDELAWFGASVAMSAAWVAVGAPFEDGNQFGFPAKDPSTDSGYDTGTVYVYRRTGEALGLEAPLIGMERGASLGAAVSLFEDQLAATAPNRIGPQKAQIYSLSAGMADAAPTAEAVLEPKDPNAYLFGFSAALRRDSLIVGAPFTGGTADGRVSGKTSGLFYQSTGTAYVYRKDAKGGWMTDPCRLKASNANPCDNLGVAVAASDDYFVVGSPLEDGNAAGNDVDGASNDLLDTGAVYTYTAP